MSGLVFLYCYALCMEGLVLCTSIHPGGIPGSLWRSPHGGHLYRGTSTRGWRGFAVSEALNDCRYRPRQLTM